MSIISHADHDVIEKLKAQIAMIDKDLNERLVNALERLVNALLLPLLALIEYTIKAHVCSGRYILLITVAS